MSLQDDIDRRRDAYRQGVERAHARAQQVERDAQARARVNAARAELSSLIGRIVGVEAVAHGLRILARDPETLRFLEERAGVLKRLIAMRSELPPPIPFEWAWRPSPPRWNGRSPPTSAVIMAPTPTLRETWPPASGVYLGVFQCRRPPLVRCPARQNPRQPIIAADPLTDRPRPPCARQRALRRLAEATRATRRDFLRDYPPLRARQTRPRIWPRGTP